MTKEKVYDLPRCCECGKEVTIRTMSLQAWDFGLILCKECADVA